LEGSWVFAGKTGASVKNASGAEYQTCFGALAEYGILLLLKVTMYTCGQSAGNKNYGRSTKRRK
jgi:hypothetical protein